MQRQRQPNQHTHKQALVKAVFIFAQLIIAIAIWYKIYTTYYYFSLLSQSIMCTALFLWTFGAIICKETFKVKEQFQKPKRSKIGLSNSYLPYFKFSVKILNFQKQNL